MARKKRKPDTSLRVQTPYIKIPAGLLESPEFNSLSPHARCLYLLFLARWDPYRPDQPFAYPYNEIREITKFNRNRISKCLTELMKEGYIEIPKRGCFPHNVSMYQIAAEPLTRKYKKKKRPIPEYLRVHLEAKELEAKEAAARKAREEEENIPPL